MHINTRPSIHSAQSTAVIVDRQLMAAWVAVVQDHAVLGTHGPLVQTAYTPRLFPAPSLSIISKVLPNLHSCWPAALRALAATLPLAAGMTYIHIATHRISSSCIPRLEA